MTGRPPLKAKPILIRLSPGLIARIEALAGKHQRAAFIREIVEVEVIRRERLGKVWKPTGDINSKHNR